MFVESRDESRQFFIHVWQKMTAGLDLEPLEALIAQVIREHPEYHALLSDAGHALDYEYLPEEGRSNPFLHMGLHVALHEQLQADRPQGIVELYQRLLLQWNHDVRRTEHKMIECLAEALWQAGRTGSMPDEHRFMDCLRNCLV
jgi:hypothetical protein